MKNKHDQSIENEKLSHLFGSTLHTASEDILNNHQEKVDINMEKIGESQEQKEPKLIIDESLEDVYLENNFDMPGTELDDSQEEIGSEDEENNYYSEADTD